MQFEGFITADEAPAQAFVCFPYVPFPRPLLGEGPIPARPKQLHLSQINKTQWPDTEALKFIKAEAHFFLSIT